MSRLSDVNVAQTVDLRTLLLFPSLHISIYSHFHDTSVCVKEDKLRNVMITPLGRYKAETCYVEVASWLVNTFCLVVQRYKPSNVALPRTTNISLVGWLSVRSGSDGSEM